MIVFEKDTLEYDTKVVIFSKKTKKYTKEVYIYLQDLNEDGEIFFNVDYEMEYEDGSFKNGNGMENLDTILDAYGFVDFNKLAAYFRYMFEKDKDAFYKIIEDVKSKGVRLSVDESEGFQGDGGFSMWG